MFNIELTTVNTLSAIFVLLSIIGLIHLYMMIHFDNQIFKDSQKRLDLYKFAVAQRTKLNTPNLNMTSDELLAMRLDIKYAIFAINKLTTKINIFYQARIRWF